MIKKERNTTVAISPCNIKILDRYCTKIGIQKIEFIPLALAFFNKYSINILLHEAPNQELSKLLQRVEFLVKFLKTQERDLLRPSCEAIFTSEERIQQHLDSLAQNDLLLKMISDLQQYFSKSHQVNTVRDKEIKESLVLIAQAIENQNVSGLSNKLKNIF